jgi:DNA/RNA endonuclease YhcR with UshA esterase domain
MKRFWMVLGFASFLVLPLLADDTNSVSLAKISAKDAGKHLNEDLTVTGKVAQVTIREKVVFINLDQPHPNAPFTAVVFAANTNQFGDLSKLKDKNVEITGQIKNYNGSAEAVLDSSNQLKIVELPAAEKPAN